MNRPVSWHRSSLGLCVLSISLNLFFCRPGFAGVGAWTTQGPQGGSVSLVVVAPGRPQTVLAVSSFTGALWRSADGGASWRRAVYIPSDHTRQIERLVIDPFDSSRYYAVLSFGQLERSTDAGVSWEPLLSDAGAVVASPTEPSVLYASTSGGLMRSTDGGDTFAAAGSLPGGSGAFLLELDPQDASTLYAVTSNGFFFSHDGGAHWTAAREGLPDNSVWSLAVDPVRPGTLYAGTVEGIWKSTDSGETWSRAVRTELIVDLAVDPLAPDNVYAVDVISHQLFHSSDAGATWRVLYNPYRPSSLALDPSASGTLYVGEQGDPEGLFGGGLAKSTNGGRTFAIVGVPDTEIWALAIDPRTPSTVYAGLAEGVYRSLDAGGHWERMPLEASVSALAIDPLRPWRIYAAAFDTVGGQFSGLFRSNDRGETWSPMTEPYTYSYLLLFDSLVVEPTVADRLYATTDALSEAQALQSTDGGSSWIAVRGLAGRRVRSITADSSSPGTLYAWGDEIRKSVDGGLKWSSTGRGLPDAEVRALAVAPGNSSFVYAATLQGIYRSDDGAETFSLVNRSFTYAGVLAAAPRGPDVLYAGTDRGVFSSADGGVTWTPFNSGLMPRYVRTLAIDPIDPEFVHAGIQGGGVSEIFVPGPCVPDATTLCFDEGRFRVRMRFETSAGGGAKGDAQVTSLAPLGLTDGAVVSFFGAKNPEVLVKVLDGCASNDRFWVFSAAATTAGFDLSVVDTWSATRRLYRNADGHPAATITDTQALAVCDAARAAAYRPPPSTAKALPAASPGKSVEPGEPCVPDATTLCLDDRPGDRRFRVRMSFATTLGNGAAGDARVASLAPLGLSRGGVLAFFSPRNPEVLVKVLDGCRNNGHFWVFAAAATTVGFELVVDDTAAGARRTYHHPDRVAAETLTDVEAFETCR